MIFHVMEVREEVSWRKRTTRNKGSQAVVMERRMVHNVVARCEEKEERRRRIIVIVMEEESRKVKSEGNIVSYYKNFLHRFLGELL